VRKRFNSKSYFVHLIFRHYQKYMLSQLPYIFSKKILPKWVVIGGVLIPLLFLFNQCNFNTKEKIDFNTQIKPILNKHCIHCHGGVKQNGGFSMMTRASILAPMTSGKSAIIPGDPTNSEFIKRLTAEDIEERMPFEANPLSSSEIELLTQWVKEGAEWGLHWAYNPVQKIEIPKTEKALGAVSTELASDWASNDIDYFINKKLVANDLTPSQLGKAEEIISQNIIPS